MQWEKSHLAGGNTTQSKQATARVYQAGSARTIDISTAARKAADFLLLIEPIWVTIAVAVVYAMVQTGGKYSWVPLLLAAIPYPLRQWRKGYLSQRTPFDIPIVLFMAGAIVGTVISKDLMLSLGALQTIVAAALLYYTLVNYPHPRHLLIGILVIACIATPLVCIWGLAAGFTPASGTNSASSWAAHILGFIPATKAPSADATPVLNPMVHGLLLVFLMLASLLVSVAVFARKMAIRIAVGIPLLLMVLFGLLSMGRAPWNLSSGMTMDGRLATWQHILPAAKEHLWTGIGLGNYSLLDFSSLGFDIGNYVPNHPHNSYLEILLNYGILGALAAIVAAVIVVKLGWGIIRSSRKRPWFGFGCGVVLAITGAAIMGFFESALTGMPSGADAHHYAVSPVPWILGAILITVHHLVRRDEQSHEPMGSGFLSAKEMRRLLS